jgi:hypothetical protein
MSSSPTPPAAPHWLLASCWVLASLSSLVLLFWASVFYLGSQQDGQDLLQNHGRLVIFLLRFVGFSLLGGIPTLGLVLGSMLFNYWAHAPTWAGPLRVLKIASTLHLVGALVGSLFFALSL